MEEFDEGIIKKISEAIEQRTLEELREERTIITPDKADKYRRLLAAWYSRYLEEIANLESETTEAWLAARPAAKTDKITDKLIAVTPGGKRLNLLKARIKYLEKLISGLRDYLRMANEEYYHQKQM